MNIAIKERDYDEHGIMYAVVVNGYTEDEFRSREDAESLAQAFRDGEVQPIRPDEPDPDAAYDARFDKDDA